MNGIVVPSQMVFLMRVVPRGLYLQVSSAWCDARKASAAAKRMFELGDEAPLGPPPLRPKTYLFLFRSRHDLP